LYGSSIRGGIHTRRATVSEPAYNRWNDILTVAGGNGDLPEGKRIKPGAIQSIRFDKVNFKYQDRFVIEGLSLYLASGRHYAIIGENGSGKSTFIKLLLNLYTPDSGTLKANETDYGDVSFEDIRTHNRIVYIEDDPCALFDDFDNNITLGDEKDEERFTEVLRAVGLYDQYTEMSAKSAEELSAGQKQRVSLARGLYHLNSETILVMDEPYSALDANAVSRMREVFASYKEKYHVTIFEITHNLNDMDRFDYIYYFENGNVKLEGNHAALMEFEQYRCYIQNYVKSQNDIRGPHTGPGP
jgi:ATP-binding cassette subfamily B protein